LQIGGADSLGILISNDSGAPTGHHFVYGVNVSGDAHVKVTDVLTFRGRAGWTAGCFLPYVFVAPGFARIDVVRSATVLWTRTDFPDPTIPVTPPIPSAFGGGTNSDTKMGGYYFVYAGGLGIDIDIMPGAFVRAEWENMQIPNVKGMSLGINTLRVGGGLRF